MVIVTLRLHFTPRKTRYPLYRRLGGTQGRSGQVRKISPPPEFDPQNVQLVACRYTDYRAHIFRHSGIEVIIIIIIIIIISMDQFIWPFPASTLYHRFLGRPRSLLRRGLKLRARLGCLVLSIPSRWPTHPRLYLSLTSCIPAPFPHPAPPTTTPSPSSPVYLVTILSAFVQLFKKWSLRRKFALL